MPVQKSLETYWMHLVFLDFQDQIITIRIILAWSASLSLHETLQIPLKVQLFISCGVFVKDCFWNISVSIIIIILLFSEVLLPALASHWSFSDSKSPQFSWTILSILADLNNAVV